MNNSILTENQKKRIDIPLKILICFAMFNFWQMGFIYYFLEPSSAIDGKIPIPINVDNATLLMIVCYLLSILTMIFLPRIIVWTQRIATGIALISAVGFFLPLPEDALRLIIYLQIFTCCLMIGFETFLVVNYFSESSSIKYLSLCYGIALFMLAIVQNEFFPVTFSIFRFGMMIALILLFIFFLSIPAGKEQQARYIKKSDGFTAPKKLIRGIYILIFICALMAVSGPAIAGKVEHGVFVMYVVEAITGFVIYFLYKKANIHPFRLIPLLVGLGGLGFLLMLVTTYIPAVSYIACGLIGFGMVSCMVSPLYGAVMMKSYPSRYISPWIIGLALIAVLVHSSIAEILLGKPVILYLVYAVIMGVLVFIYTQMEPFFLFTLRRRSTEHNETSDNDTAITESAVTQAQEKPDPLAVLTPREREVAEFICMGYTNADIAKMMFITEHTVKDHTKKIYPKMGVRSRFELATLVSKHRSDNS